MIRAPSAGHLLYNRLVYYLGTQWITKYFPSGHVMSDEAPPLSRLHACRRSSDPDFRRWCADHEGGALQRGELARYWSRIQTPQHAEGICGVTLTGHSPGNNSGIPHGFDKRSSRRPRFLPTLITPLSRKPHCQRSSPAHATPNPHSVHPSSFGRSLQIVPSSPCE